MIKTFLLSSIETAVNKYLQCDENSERRLAKMAGKSVTIELMPLQIMFVCSFHEEGVTVKVNEDADSAAVIKGTPLQLLGVLIDKNHRHQFFAEDVKIEGDAEFAQQVIYLFDHVEIDWEEQTASIIGDVPAYQLSKLAGEIRGWLGNNGKAFTQDINDYLHEEAAWFPAKEELQEFFADIDTLRMDTDRLEARLTMLRSQLNNEESQ